MIQGKGKHKPEIQKLYEELKECGKRLIGYKDCFEIMGKDRNSYSKTDLIGKYCNMKYEVFEDEHYYVCYDGRELRHIRTEKKEQDGYTQLLEMYGCADCSGCEHKFKCLYRYNKEKNPNKGLLRTKIEYMEKRRPSYFDSGL